MFLPGTVIRLFSTLYPLASIATKISLDVIDPKSLSDSETFEDILIFSFFSLLPNSLASSITFLSLNCCCLIFSSRIFFDEGVAKIAFPLGIKKFLP